uniref:HTH psq-type domain-containing protein n=1 Tax=Timema shepardi TaxID=629360 RepID=A0A7R9B182_TIMSH|nr:unnamed protein product [Timema shepardi]
MLSAIRYFIPLLLGLQAELTAAHKDSELVRKRMNRLEEDLNEFKQKNMELAEELVRKAEELQSDGSNEKRVAELESSLEEVQVKVKTLETELQSIQKDRDSLQKEREDMLAEREEEMKIVQEALEESQEEKMAIQARFEKDFERLRTVNTDREQQLLDDFEWKLREVEQACKRRLEEKDKVTEERIREMKRAIEGKVKVAEKQLQENEQPDVDNESIFMWPAGESCHLRADYEDEDEREQLKLRRWTIFKMMGVLSSHLSLGGETEQLQVSEKMLKEEISRLQSSLNKEKAHYSAMQTIHDRRMAELEKKLQARLDQQSSELTAFWEDRVRKECSRFKVELDHLHSEEKKLAVEAVRFQKEQELKTAKLDWERRMQDSHKERTTLTLIKKYEIIQEVDEKKITKKEIVRRHGILNSTLFTILRMREEIVNAVQKEGHILKGATHANLKWLQGFDLKMNAANRKVVLLFVCFPPLAAPKTQTTHHRWMPIPSQAPPQSRSLALQQHLRQPPDFQTFTQPCAEKTWQRLAPDCMYEEYITADNNITVWGTLDDANIIREQQESSDEEGEEEMKEEPEDISMTKDVLKAGDVYSRELKRSSTSEELWSKFYNVKDFVKKIGANKKQASIMDFIASLKERVVEKDSYYSNELERSQTNADRDILELRRKLDKLDLQYQEQIEKLVDKHEKEIDSLNEDAERKIQQLEQNWQLQMSSTRATLELVKEQMERDAQSRLEAAGEKHRNQLAMQWEQLLEEKEKALEVEVEKHRGQLDKVKQELEHAVKARNIRESELLETIEQLRAQLDSQSTTISDLEGNVDLLEGGMQVLNQEITTQSHEMTKVQQQAAIRISDGTAGPAMAAKGSHFPAALSVFLIPFFSWVLSGSFTLTLSFLLVAFAVLERDATREAELHRRLGELATKHAGQQKQWQAQMCQMQEAAQKKINNLLQLLEESHQQCENCKSRPGDTQLIADLQKIVSEKDRELASLTEEKRFYQMELVNRETNYNRLFNSQPIVGVMDTLQHRRCKGSSGGCAPSNKANSKQITIVTSSYLPSPVSDSLVQRSHSMDMQELVFSVPSDRCQSLDTSVSLPLPSANSTNNERSLQPDTVP